MNCFTVESGPYRAQVIAPKDGAKLPLLYLHDACPAPQRVRSLLSSRLTLVSVSGVDWYRDSGRATSLHGNFIDINPGSGDSARPC